MIEKKVKNQINREELFDYINTYDTLTVMENISCYNCPLFHSNGGECRYASLEKCQHRFEEFYREEEKRNERSAANREMEIGEVKNEEDLFNYIDVFGLEKTTMRLSCGNCPLADSANDDCEYGLERCKNRLRDFYMTRRGKSNSLRTKASVIFEEEKNNQVAIKDLPVGTFFIFCNRLYEVIKNAEGGTVKVKEWNTSEIGSFADEVKVEVVDIEIKVKRRKEG